MSGSSLEGLEPALAMEFSWRRTGNRKQTEAEERDTSLGRGMERTKKAERLSESNVHRPSLAGRREIPSRESVRTDSLSRMRLPISAGGTTNWRREKLGRKTTNDGGGKFWPPLIQRSAEGRTRAR